MNEEKKGNNGKDGKGKEEGDEAEEDEEAEQDDEAEQGDEDEEPLPVEDMPEDDDDGGKTPSWINSEGEETEAPEGDDVVVEKIIKEATETPNPKAKAKAKAKNAAKGKPKAKAKGKATADDSEKKNKAKKSPKAKNKAKKKSNDGSDAEEFSQPDEDETMMGDEEDDEEPMEEAPKKPKKAKDAKEKAAKTVKKTEKASTWLIDGTSWLTWKRIIDNYVYDVGFFELINSHMFSFQPFFNSWSKTSSENCRPPRMTRASPRPWQNWRERLEQANEAWNGFSAGFQWVRGGHFQ